jgi:Ala-tRNA(Pro) deacylase
MDDPYAAIIQLLSERQVSYDQIEHEPVYTSEQAAAVRGMSLAQGAKSLLFKTKAGFVLVVVPGDKRVDSKLLKKVLGVKDVRFASPDEVKECMGCEIGSCYPLGIVAGLRTLVDRSLSRQAIISFNPGRHNISIKMRYGDYQTLAQPEVVAVTK